MTKDKLYTSPEGNLIGSFFVKDLEYTILDTDYDEVPKDLPDKFVLQAVKQVAIVRCATQGKVTTEARKRNTDIIRKQGMLDTDSALPRFAGSVLCVDGSNIAYRAKYAVNTDHNGQDTSIVYGVLRSLLSEMSKVDDLIGVIVAWDGKYPKFRKDAVPTYKSKARDNVKWTDEEKEDFYRQLGLLQDILPKMGILSIRLPHAEADDIIAATCHVLHPDVRKIILSSDLDMMQLVNYHCHIRVPGTDPIITSNNFMKATGGVAKKDYLVYKAMVGDSSDNIPGLKGVGEAKAKQIIDSIGSDIHTLTDKEQIEDILSEHLVNLLVEFGEDGFNKVIECIRLDRDRVGSRLAVVNATGAWQAYDKLAIKEFLSSQGITTSIEISDIIGRVKHCTSLHKWVLATVRTPVI